MRVHPLLGLLIFLATIYLMSTLCLGCKKSFDRINQHQLHCTRYHNLAGGGLKRRVQEDETARRVKARKLREDRDAAVAAKAAAEAEAARLAEEARAREEAARPIEIPTFSRAGRARRAPVWLRQGDMVPTSLAGLPEHIPRPPPPPPPRPPAPTVEEVPDEDPVNPQPPQHMDPPPIETPDNSFGVFRQYTQIPQHDPEEGLTLEAFTDISSHTEALRPQQEPVNPTRPFGSVRAVAAATSEYFAPFLNATVFRLMAWFYSGSAVKSAAELDRLVHDVLLAPDFNVQELDGFSAKTELTRMDKHTQGTEEFPAADGWRSGTVKIALPKVKAKHQCEADAPTLEVKNIFYRPFLAAIKAACEDATAARLHHVPFKLFSRQPTSATSASVSSPASSHDDPLPPPTSPPRNNRSSPPADGDARPQPTPERLHSEVYNSDAHIELNRVVQEKAQHDREPGDDPKMEYAAVPVMVSSDSTHLTNFGTASLWPIYFYLLGLTKYVRGMPTSFAAHHLAYIPSLPDIIQQVYEDAYNSAPTAAILRYCKKELMQQIWLLLLDDEFVHAYEHGFVVRCGDGIVRRLFPRILVYCADYPEKCLIACIKFLGKCPCPDCLVEKSRIHLMGTKHDLAARVNKPREDTPWLRATLARVRGWIFGRGLGPEGKAVENVLGKTSTSPNQSAFSRRLGAFGFDIYRALVPDIMHEFELGVWKSALTHLIRILTAVGTSTVIEFNARFAQVPTFGRTTIRRFGNNVAGLKKLAARDFEDLIQCAIPVFEGLLPAVHDRVVRRMLFHLAMWHALAKLRLHSDTTLAVFEGAVKKLGQVMREFASQVCPEYDTRELDKEVEARQRRKAKKDTKGRSATTAARAPALGEADRAPKVLNLSTYKFHRCGDGPRTVRLVGTLEGVSTQTSETEHRRVKRFYAHTNKNATFGLQIAHHERRERFANAAQKRAPAVTERADRRRRLLTQESSGPLGDSAHDRESLGLMSPEEHTKISLEQRNPVDILGFVHENEGDPAVASFIPDLRHHIHSRLRAGDNEPQDEYEPTREELAAVRFRHDRMYVHKRMQVNYTTYDMRREQDSINPSSQADIMVLAPPGSPHPYLYARVLGIFHVNAYLANDAASQPTAVPVLWVRWYQLDSPADWGLHSATLPRVSFAHLDDEPFGFLSPDQVLRASHIIPAFAHGRSDVALPGNSIARHDSEDDEDYSRYYIGIFVDRDMFMRYLGGGVGHRQTGGVGGTISDLDTLRGVDVNEPPLDEDINMDDPEAPPEELPAAPPSDDEDEDVPAGPGGAADDPNDEELDYGYVRSDDEEELPDPQEDGDEYLGFAPP